MHKLAMTMAASAAILCLSSIGWSANAMTGPGPAKGLPGANATRRGRRPHAKAGGGPYCPPGYVRRCGPRIVAGAAPATDRRNGDEFPAHAIVSDWKPEPLVPDSNRHDFERKVWRTIVFRTEEMRQLTFGDPGRATYLRNGGRLFEPVLERLDGNLIAIHGDAIERAATLCHQKAFSAELP
jgi:hypothetical protein